MRYCIYKIIEKQLACAATGVNSLRSLLGMHRTDTVHSSHGLDLYGITQLDASVLIVFALRIEGRSDDDHYCG
jgi:hypothetical protein